MKPRAALELEKMRKSGQISAHALKKAVEMAQVGVNLLDIEQAAEEIIHSMGGESSFKTVPGYRWTTCLTVNNEVVHGIPRDYVLKPGDILSIDLGSIYDGWHTDCAWSVLVGGKGRDETDTKNRQKFLAAGEESLWKAIKQAKAGNRIGDISNAMQSAVEGPGYKIVRTLVGHGIGRALHEEPEVPGFGEKGVGIKLLADETLAIESIYTESTYDVMLAADDWTYVSDDGSLAGMFEMTVIIGEKQAEVLTDWRKV